MKLNVLKTAAVGLAVMALFPGNALAGNFYSKEGEHFYSFSNLCDNLG